MPCRILLVRATFSDELLNYLKKLRSDRDVAILNEFRQASASLNQLGMMAE